MAGVGTIDGMTALLAAAPDLEALGAGVRTHARALAEAQGATFVLRDGDSCFYADEDAMSPLWKGQRFPLTQCITGWAMLNRAVADVPDIDDDPRVPREVYRATFVRSLVAVPIMTPGHDGSPGAAVGAIGVYWDHHRTPSADLLARLQTLAALAGEAMERIGLDDAPWAPTFLRTSRATS
jgi:GAF domain-containing protein